jgi:hypothetical protein
MDADAPRHAVPDGTLDEVVLARLDRIEAFGRRRAASDELLHELRGLLRDAEAGTVSTGSGEEVVERLRTAPHGT